MEMMKDTPHEYDDDFGKPGYASKTMKITLVIILFWMIVIFPFVFVILSLYLIPNSAEVWRIIVVIGFFLLLG